MTNITITESFVNTYVTGMHVNTILSTFMGIFCVYLILLKTPLNMQTYKWYLLNVVICSYVFDLHTTLLYIPLPLTPAPVFCVEGYFKYIITSSHTAFFIMIQFLSFYGISLLAAFCYRYALVINKVDKLHSKKSIVIMLVLHIVFLWPTMILFSPVLLNSDETSDIYEQIYPGITLSMEGRLCGGLRPTTLTTVAFVSVCLDALLIGTAIFNVLLLTFKSLNKNKSQFSSTTHKMYKQLTISLTLQFVFPLTLIMAPFIILSVLFILGYNRPIHTAIGFQTMTLHSVFNGIAMISFTKPYKDAIICKIFQKNNIQQVSSHLIVEFTTNNNH